METHQHRSAAEVAKTRGFAEEELVENAAVGDGGGGNEGSCRQRGTQHGYQVPALPSDHW